MVIESRRLGLLASVLLAFSGIGAANEEPKVLTWDDLIPQGELERQRLAMLSHNDQPGDEFDWEEDSFEEALSTPVYQAGVVEELNGQQVKLPGFIVPLEMEGEGKVAEFLLVPYFGACIHYPAPPPNQIVYVTLADPIELKSMWDPVWLTGELRTETHHSSLASAGYSMAGNAVEDYEY